VAMWDERCTNHRGLSDHYPAHRLIRRCLVGEGVPTGPERATVGAFGAQAAGAEATGATR
jgi:hypothetical protein